MFWNLIKLSIFVSSALWLGFKNYDLEAHPDFFRALEVMCES